VKQICTRYSIKKFAQDILLVGAKYFIYRQKIQIEI